MQTNLQVHERGLLLLCEELTALAMHTCPASMHRPDVLEKAHASAWTGMSVHMYMVCDR